MNLSVDDNVCLYESIDKKRGPPIEEKEHLHAKKAKREEKINFQRSLTDQAVKVGTRPRFWPKFSARPPCTSHGSSKVSPYSCLARKTTTVSKFYNLEISAVWKFCPSLSKMKELGPAGPFLPTISARKACHHPVKYHGAQQLQVSWVCRGIEGNLDGWIERAIPLESKVLCIQTPVLIDSVQHKHPIGTAVDFPQVPETKKSKKRNTASTANWWSHWTIGSERTPFWPNCKTEIFPTRLTS